MGVVFEVRIRMLGGVAGAPEQSGLLCRCIVQPRCLRAEMDGPFHRQVV